MHHILRIAASSMGPNTTTMMQQKNQFHKSHCKQVSDQIKQIAITVYKREWWCACCCYSFLFC